MDIHTFCRSCSYNDARNGRKSKSVCGLEASDSFNPRLGDDKPKPSALLCGTCSMVFSTNFCNRCRNSLLDPGAVLYGTVKVEDSK